MPNTMYKKTKQIEANLKLQGFEKQIRKEDIEREIRIVAGGTRMTLNAYIDMLCSFNIIRKVSDTIFEFMEEKDLCELEEEIQKQ